MLSLFARVHQTAAYLVWSNVFTSSAHFSIRTLVFHCWPSECHQLGTLSSMHWRFSRAACEGVVRCVPSVMFFSKQKDLCKGWANLFSHVLHRENFVVSLFTADNFLWEISLWKKCWIKMWSSRTRPGHLWLRADTSSYLCLAACLR